MNARNNQGEQDFSWNQGCRDRNLTAARQPHHPAKHYEVKRLPPGSPGPFSSFRGFRDWQPRPGSRSPP